VTDIGSIVASNDHLTYLCRIYGPLEVDHRPARSDYSLGRFVAIPLDEMENVSLVGMITDSALINPDYGSYGPRLSSESDLEVFSPDSVNERGVLVTIRLVGSVSHALPSHDIPVWIAEAGSAVAVMDASAVCKFHQNSDGAFIIAYYPRLVALRDAVLQRLLLRTLEMLAPSFPDDKPIIDLLRGNLAWQANVAPFE
jgi:hypothetical protein